MLTQTRPHPAPGTGPPLARPQPASRPVTGPRGADLWATSTLILLTLASVIGLVRVFLGHTWYGPVVVTAIGVHLVCWATRRFRLPLVVAATIDLGAGWLLVGWTLLPHSTTGGLPLGRTWTQLTAALRDAHNSFASAIPPVEPTLGFKLMAVIGVALIAVVADWAAFRWRSALYGAVGPFAYFVICCAVSGGRPGRGEVIWFEITALLIFLLTHRTLVGHADEAWFGNERRGLGMWALTAGGIAATIALVAAMAVTPLMRNGEGVGVFGWKGGLGEGGGPRVVANPVVDLHTRLEPQLGKTNVFAVTSPVASYWRLTSLDTFDGQQWVSTDSYRGLGQRLPGVQAVPPGTRLVTANVSIEQLNSVWLPDAFTPVSVTGVKSVSYDPRSGSLITSHATSNGLSYTVESYQFLSTLSPAALKAAPPLQFTGDLSSYLQLPVGIPQSVYELANQITAGQTTEYGKALALQNFFWSPGNHFTYSLNPPDDGYGIEALTNFLFSTRTGFCQQFAGAYAVLARAVGLPTRLAVGFTTGNAEGNNTYQVTDGDAHTWPEVYFGPKFGWLPFEPTKSKSDPASNAYAPAVGGVTTAPASGASTAPINRPKATGSGPSSATTLPPLPTRPVPAARGASHHNPITLWTGLLGLLALLVGWVGLVVGGRRLRWWFRRSRTRGSPAGLVQTRWSDVIELLAWWGTVPDAGETDVEFGHRAAREAEVRLSRPSVWLRGRVGRLSDLATEAAFAAHLPTERAEEAHQLAADIRRELFRAANARLLLRWILLPKPRPYLPERKIVTARPAPA